MKSAKAATPIPACDYRGYDLTERSLEVPSFSVTARCKTKALTGKTPKAIPCTQDRKGGSRKWKGWDFLKKCVFFDFHELFRFFLLRFFDAFLVGLNIGWFFGIWFLGWGDRWVGWTFSWWNQRWCPLIHQVLVFGFFSVSSWVYKQFSVFLSTIHNGWHVSSIVDGSA